MGETALSVCLTHSQRLQNEMQQRAAAQEGFSRTLLLNSPLLVRPPKFLSSAEDRAIGPSAPLASSPRINGISAAAFPF
jgi:hypothetical protein